MSVLNGQINTSGRLVVFCFGRLNPPTIGHARLVEAMRVKAAERGGELRVFLSRSHDRTRNPLAPEEKLSVFRRLFPAVPVALSQTLGEAIETLKEAGYEQALLIVGEDRATQFRSLVVPGIAIEVGWLDRSAEDASATQARKMAASGDMAGFADMIPGGDEDLKRELYRAVRLGIGVRWPMES